MRHHHPRIVLPALSTQGRSTQHLYKEEIPGPRNHPENCFVLTGMWLGLHFLLQMAGVMEDIDPYVHNKTFVANSKYQTLCPKNPLRDFKKVCSTRQSKNIFFSADKALRLSTIEPAAVVVGIA